MWNCNLIKEININSWKSKWNIIIIIVLALLLIIYIRFQNKSIEVEKIEVEIENLSNELSGLRIVHLSDLHIPDNGPSIKNIIKEVENQKPDVIVMTGDIIDGDVGNKIDELTELSIGLSNITTTYAVSGNHEKRNGNYDNWKEAINKSDVKIIDNEVDLYTKNGASLLFIGVEDSNRKKFQEYNGKSEFDGIPKILLAHHPEYFEWYSSKEFGAELELMFSGHAHGGQFRIPFINMGIIAPGQGIFPKKTSGIYTNSQGKNLVVSRGLGSSSFPIRLNNRVHLPVIELKCK